MSKSKVNLLNENAFDHKISLEKSFEIMEDYINRLEDDEITLEESFQLYTKGMELIKHCNLLIEKVEKQVMMLDENGELHEF